MSGADTARLVSVITPFLDMEEFIEEAIESVFAQAYPDWELLLVDDGSSDASTGIARRYARNHPGKVRYLEHPGHRNCGASAARNLGMSNARGGYIAFLDSDDVWLPEKLARQVAVLNHNPRAGMIIGASRYWYGWTGKAEDVDRDVVLPVSAPQDALIEPPLLSALLYPLGGGAAPSLNSVIVRSTVVQQIGGWEEQFRYFYTDQVFLSKLYLRTPIYVESACSDLYRQHGRSSMTKAEKARDYHRVRRSFLEWFEDHLDAEGFDDVRVLEPLREALWRYRHPAAYHFRELQRRPLERTKGVLMSLLRGTLLAGQR